MSRSHATPRAAQLPSARPGDSGQTASRRRRALPAPYPGLRGRIPARSHRPQFEADQLSRSPLPRRQRLRAVDCSHVRLPVPDARRRASRPAARRCGSVRRRPAGSAVTAERAELANLSAFRLKTGHQSSRAESAFCAASWMPRPYECLLSVAGEAPGFPDAVGQAWCRPCWKRSTYALGPLKCGNAPAGKWTAQI